MNFADVIFLVLAVFLAIRGYFKGFISEFMSMAALVFGIAAGILFRGNVAPMLGDLVKSATWRPVVAFVILFVGTFILVKLAEFFLHNVVKTIQLNSLDRILGFVWGLLEISVFILLVVYLIYHFEFDEGITFIRKSKVAKYALEILQEYDLNQQLKDLPVIGDIDV